jgi:hypothetical protein
MRICSSKYNAIINNTEITIIFCAHEPADCDDLVREGADDMNMEDGKRILKEDEMNAVQPHPLWFIFNSAGALSSPPSTVLQRPPPPPIGVENPAREHSP